MLSADFARTLHEAQAGDQIAFLRLWRDANPMMIRYLRVAGVDDPCVAAAQGWVAVIHGMAGFGGDELAWRAWVLGCTRPGAVEAAVSHARGVGSSMAEHRAARQVSDSASAQHTDLAASHSPTRRGIDQTIAAIRDLPLGQGEILVLRLVAQLPVALVADLVGTDVVTVRRAEAGAVERLGAERELLAWSLSAPPVPAELRDERVALRAFVTHTGTRRPVPHTRVIAVGRPVRTPGRRADRFARSRALAVCIAVLSASAMSLGGLSAAAYVGMLPPGVQRVMHRLIGAPAPSLTTIHSHGIPGAGPTQRATGVGTVKKGPKGDPTAGLTGSSSRSGVPPGNSAAPGHSGTPNARATSKQPHPTKPAPGASGQAKPDPTKRAPTKPDPTNPVPTKPDPTKPVPTRPDPTKPVPTKPSGAGTPPAEPSATTHAKAALTPADSTKK
ncbi:MAG TPA: hypothetical protein VGN48_14860 [Pedococcus sp.]|nr:hypothetical protein [Pedococcus sp.]